MLNIGLSSCGKPLCEEFFESCKNAGITHIEISPSPAESAEMDFAGLARLSRQSGVSLWSYHLPFCSPEYLDISSPDAEVRRRAVESHCKTIGHGADAGIKIFVVHASSEPIPDKTRAMQLDIARESLDTLARTAERCGEVIAVEDLPRSCLGHNSAEMLYLIGANPGLRICFDTNHLLIEDNLDFIDAVGKYIATTHVSDYDFIDERHWLPGEGKVDWQALYKKLVGTGYNGVWMYELGFTSPKSICRPRDLTCGDFAKNAREIFEGKPITVSGVPNSELYK